MNALPIIIGALCVIAISYRYYSAFIAAKVLALDDSRPVPSQTSAPRMTTSAIRGLLAGSPPAANRARQW